MTNFDPGKDLERFICGLELAAPDLNPQKIRIALIQLKKSDSSVSSQTK